MKRFFCGCLLAIGLALVKPAFAGNSPARAEVEVSFKDLPATLYSLMNNKTVVPCLTYCLPEGYNPTNSYPLVVYLPGNDGNPKGNITKARYLAGTNGWIAATLPLFKQRVDRDEIGGGVLMGYEDAPILARAYATMLDELFKRVPNIDRKKSAVVGFSNGAIAVGVLVSTHDEFILDHFQNFCLVDHGMFHLTDLHKSRARTSRFLLLTGDRPEFGRDLKNRQAKLQAEAWQQLDVKISSRVLPGTGHEFNESQMDVVREWLREATADGLPRARIGAAP